MVVEAVKRSFRLLAKSQNIEISDKDIPEVFGSDMGSSYSSEDRTIRLSVYDATSESVFEEVGHALRDLAMRRKGSNREKQDSSVHEFYGMSASIIGKELIKGTYLEKFFKDMGGKESREMPQIIKFYKKDKEEINKIEKALLEFEQRKGKLSDSLEGLAEAYSLAVKILRDCSDKSNYEKLNHLSKIISDGIVLLQINGCSKLEQIGNVRDFARFLENYGGDKPVNVENKVKEGRFFENLGTVKRRKVLARNIRDVLDYKKYSLEVHTKPYLYALQYSAEELMAIDGFFSIPDKKVKRRFFYFKDPDFERRLEG